MPIHKYLDLSTAHITKSDNDILDAACEPDAHKWLFPLVVVHHGYGWWIHVPQTDVDSTLADCVEKGLSDAFCKIIRHASKKKCLWVNIDSDGEFSNKFEKHIW